MIDEIQKRQIGEVAKKHGLEFVVLFGSQATGRVHAKSDIDIAVMSKKAFDIYKVMSDFDPVFKRDDVETVDLSMASPTLMYVVVRDGKLLYEERAGDFFRWKLYAIKIWMETGWLRELQRHKLIEWAKAQV